MSLLQLAYYILNLRRTSKLIPPPWYKGGEEGAGWWLQYLLMRGIGMS